MIDLHLHSNASDGLLSPAEVVRHAARGGLSAIALTDHDTLEGLAEAIEAGERHGVEVVPGVEISVVCEGAGTLHLIGLFVDLEDGPLREALAWLREGRADRNRRLARRLADLGVPVTVEEAREHAGGEVLARPHFALAMVAKGHVATVKDAFDEWMGKGRPGYEDRERLAAAEVLRLVHGAGGVAVLCHPATLDLDGPGNRDALPEFIRELRNLGLDAMEVRYAERDRSREKKFRRIAKRLELLESGGSDFHGHSARDLRSGIRRQNLGLPCEMLEALRERARSYRRGER